VHHMQGGYREGAGKGCMCVVVCVLWPVPSPCLQGMVLPSRGGTLHALTGYSRRLSPWPWLTCVVGAVERLVHVWRGAMERAGQNHHLAQCLPALGGCGQCTLITAARLSCANWQRVTAPWQ
jgi:hypothetical protein